SVQKVHGSEASIRRIREKYDPDLESMEGAACFYVCMLEGVPFLQIRAISNYVEPRNRDNWEIGLAIDKLNEILVGFFASLGNGA
ncbi:MAG: hypothetical protein KDC34_10330, partial [Saprospiraceae bacterium]|nr:hypothetical protein [Saprospiraceae bacterium]